MRVAPTQQPTPGADHHVASVPPVAARHLLSLQGSTPDGILASAFSARPLAKSPCPAHASRPGASRKTSQDLRFQYFAAFLNGIELVHLKVFVAVDLSRRPSNLDEVDRFCLSRPKCSRRSFCE